MNEYQQQAVDFLKSANAEMSIRYRGLVINDLWGDNKERPSFNVEIETPRGKMNFVFYGSLYYGELIHKYLFLMNGEFYECKAVKSIEQIRAKLRECQITQYDVLACLTKYDVGTFEDFCAEFGYDEDSRRAEKIYIGCIKEYKDLERIFTPEQMEQLREIN